MRLHGCDRIISRRNRMPCEEVKSPKYQTRKSPPFHAKDCKDLAKKGKNGTYVSQADSRGVYKWVKTGSTRKAAKGSKTYYIHDNGSKPYKIQVSGNSVEIYKGAYRRDVFDTKAIDYETMDYDKLVKRLTVKEVIVGKSPCVPMADACGASNDGNTVLLHVSGKKYMHVGHDIFEFTVDDEVDTYYSLIGNNDVPYPVLVGTQNVYFMLDHMVMPRAAFKAKMGVAEWADAYRFFYGMRDLETGEHIKCTQKGKKGDKCIQDRNKLEKKIQKDYVTKMKGLKILS